MSLNLQVLSQQEKTSDSHATDFFYSAFHHEMEALQLCLQTQLEIKELWNKLQAKGRWKPSGAGETPARLPLPV